MCEVTNRNFNEKYDDIIRDISSSDFIAIDCEFSGLGMSPLGFSLLDTPAARYDQLRRHSDYLSFQIGISAFRHTRNDKYEATTYTFYVFPRPYVDATRVFTSQVSSVFFLSKLNFDFNKVFHDGITFTRLSDEASLERDLRDGSLVRRLRGHMSGAERKELQTHCEAVRNWRATAKPGDRLELHLDVTDPFVVWLVRHHIQTLFGGVRACPASPPSTLTVKLEEDVNPKGSDAEMQNELRDLVFGLTRLIKAVAALGKPLVGHNMFSDILTIYNMFVAPLPVDYEEFKRSIVGLFPAVYDTKVLASEVQSLTGRSIIGKWTSLERLYHLFVNDSTGEGEVHVPDMPAFEGSPNKNHHDSGFDSYCTGFVFVKMAHMLSLWCPVAGQFQTVPGRLHEPATYFDTVKHLKNRVNIIRGSAPYVLLDGPDPSPTTKPDVILLESYKGEEIDIQKVASEIAKFSGADFKAVTSSQALIACSNKVISKVIFKHYAQSDRYRLRRWTPETAAPLRRPRGTATLAFVLFGVTGLVSLVWYRQRRRNWGGT